MAAERGRGFRTGDITEAYWYFKKKDFKTADYVINNAFLKKV